MNLDELNKNIEQRKRNDEQEKDLPLGVFCFAVALICGVLWIGLEVFL